ncbi:Glycosyltransferase, GT2 family [Microbacterium sp. cf046]|uniref:glycosyltransferase family 2 protein n=1 Tax=Microbacterium sp. cf046 TaxID=1761803 RepID=UPI0008E37E05|nr:glycosyltransferase family 2 protein [Microbacterium sp. cf046]SFR90934.1 Glycosyltransferase, GT2 family [Microbacterium sp. cf046]
MPRSAAVIVATYRRPDYVRECLDHLALQTVAPDRIIVVDASPDDLTRAVVAEYPHVEYRRNDMGAGTLASSRAIGVQGVTEDVIAFIDDDAYAEPQWLEELLAAYDLADVGAVGGRARNGQPGEETEGIDRIGRFLRNGRLTGFFAADPGRIILADHMLGANMSVRTDVLRSFGGIHDYYPGTCLREDADIALRVRLAGHRVVYAPAAVVRHVAGDYASGRRFDLRYRYYGARNHIMLLVTTIGWADPRFVRYLASAAAGIPREALSGLSAVTDASRPSATAKVRGIGGGFVRATVDLAGTLAGLARAVRPVDRARSVPPLSPSGSHGS